MGIFKAIGIAFESPGSSRYDSWGLKQLESHVANQEKELPRLQQWAGLVVKAEQNDTKFNAIMAQKEQGVMGTKLERLKLEQSSRVARGKYKQAALPIALKSGWW